MIGCDSYTSTISCMQYVQDVYMMKFFLLAVLIIASLLMIYFSKTKYYKQLTEEFTSFKTFFFLPRWLSYVFLAFSFYFPFLLSVKVPLDSFLNFIYAFVIPVVAWFSLLSFLLFIDWLFQRFGFESFGHFVRSAMKKNK